MLHLQQTRTIRKLLPIACRINLGATPDVMVVGFLTANMSAPSVVQYGTKSGIYDHVATGTSAYYTYSSKYTSGLIHHVPLTGLAPSTVYYYRAAGDLNGACMGAADAPLRSSLRLPPAFFLARA